MTIGTSNQTQLSFIKEVTPGTTPGTPALQILRYLSESLQVNNSTTQSQEITANRDVPDLIVTDQSNSGDTNHELSGASFDALMEGALMSDATWSADSLSASTVAATATGFTDSGNGFVSSGFNVGQFVKVAGFTDTTINGFYRIETVVAGEITTYPAPPATEVAGASVTVVGSTISNGVTDHSYTVQKAFLDLDTPSYQNFRGCRISTMSMNLSVGSILTIGFGFMGMSSESVASNISGATYTAKTTTDVMNAVTNISNIVATNESSVTTAIKFTDLSLSYDNSLRDLKAIGVLGSIDIRAGTIQATGNINPYFENIQLLEAYLASTEFTLSWQATSADGYTYIFSLPAVKFTSQGLAAGSRDADMIINGQVQGILDSASSSTMRIDRFTP